MPNRFLSGKKALRPEVNVGHLMDRKWIYSDSDNEFLPPLMLYEEGEPNPFFEPLVGKVSALNVQRQST